MPNSSAAAGDPNNKAQGNSWLKQVGAASDFRLSATTVEITGGGGGFFGSGSASGRLIMEATGNSDSNSSCTVIVIVIVIGIVTVTAIAFIAEATGKTPAAHLRV